MNARTIIVAVAAILLAAGGANAQTHAPWPTDWNNWSDPALWVSVGNPGNAGEWSGESYGGWGPNRICGAVDYTYKIGIYEVTNAQWGQFLDALAAYGDPYGLYSSSMCSTYGGIARSGSGAQADPYVYTPKNGDPGTEGIGWNGIKLSRKPL